MYQNCVVCLSPANAENPGQTCLNGYSPDSTPPFEMETISFRKGGQQKAVVLSLEDKQTLWTKIVDEYTERELAYPEKDKFLALYRVASFWGSSMEDEYIAGHF